MFTEEGERKCPNVIEDWSEDLVKVSYGVVTELVVNRYAFNMLIETEMTISSINADIAENSDSYLNLIGNLTLQAYISANDSHTYNVTVTCTDSKSSQTLNFSLEGYVGPEIEPPEEPIISDGNNTI